MATVVPKTPMQQSKPEVIFVADQSSSMRGDRTKTLVAALRVFLKSLPVGIKFNICYFGTYDSFLFPESQMYDQKSLEKALESLDGLDGKLGGTETLNAVRASVNCRDVTQPLSIILATDGDIWQQQQLFDYVNDSVATAKKTLRVFALGIGNSVSSALIEGVARAGNGFAQSVGEGEKLDGKVIRMLRGALTPDHGAYTMEIQYQKDDDDDEFVMVERVTDSLRVLAFDDADWSDAQVGDEPDASAETMAAGKKGVDMPDTDGEARYNHVPAVSGPKLMQTPQSIPPLYPFNRTNVYILISPDAAQGTIKSVILKSGFPEKPFELEIPIEILSERGETIHQLAAKKTIVDLEEGRGWLVHAKDEKGVLTKDRYPTHFQSMVEREAVRLGIQYQIAGRFTSFVATETDPRNPVNNVSRKIGIIKQQAAYAQTAQPNNMSLFGAPSSGGTLAMPVGSGSGALFGSATSTPFSGRSGGSLFGAMKSTRSSARMSTDIRAPRKQSARVGSSLFSGGPSLDASISDKEDTKAEEKDPLQKIVALQTFEGYWNLDAPLLEVVGLPVQHEAPQGVDPKVWATVLAISFLEGKMAGDQEAWEMVVEKARGWLKEMEEGQEGGFEEKRKLAKEFVMGSTL